MDIFGKIWNYSLVTLSSGGQITIGQTVSVIIFVGLALVLSRFLSRLLARQLERGKTHPDAIQTIQMIFFWGFMVLVFISALGMLNIPIAHLAFISGAVAIGVGFGAQNVINNLISGWILMSEKPVRVGDFVELDNNMGTVERIGNRSTRIRRIDGVHLLVPNSQMLERVVVNWTLVDRRFRTSVRVGVVYGSPVDRVAELLGEVARADENVLKDPQPTVVFEDFGDNALVFDLFFWCEIASGMELRLLRSRIRFAIERLFRENGIVVAFPQRDVHLDTTRPLEIRMQADDRGSDDAGESK